MRTLSATLLAAQKKADRLPYVVAKVYDYEAGIKRLSWTRLYEGSEPDNHHGIAFDGQGSMHRIRAYSGESALKLIGSDDQTSIGGATANRFEANRYVAEHSGSMTEFRVKSHLSGTYHVKVAIYAHDSGEDAPGALINAVDTSQAIVQGWNTIAFPATDIVEGTTYWLAFNSDAVTVGYWDQTGNLKRYRNEEYAAFTFPDPAGDMPNGWTHYPDIIAGWRASTSDAPKLYYQKITDPGPSSDYSQWTEIATDCAVPCAIAAYGAKVYIFYKTTGNVLWKYYSSDYGQSWNNAQLASYADVLTMAAAWWGTGDVVVCFALKSNELNGIVLDTFDQSTSQHIKEFHGAATHIFLDTYGIGATFNPFWPAIEIVFAGKESDSPYNHYDLFRTWFSDAYNFHALESFLMSPDGEDITYEYPDCHLPASAHSYETNRIVAVEKFVGTTAYTRPLACHMVKGTYWSDTTFTEPKPFLDETAVYGLRLSSTPGHWGLSTPSGVWRAPRPADPPLDLTKDIVSLTQQTQGTQRTQGTLMIELNNSKGQYASPGEGALASLRFRSEIVLELGYKTTAGKETSEAGAYWVDGWQYSTTQQTQSTLTLFCLDGWGLMDRWTARYQMRWNKDEVNPKSVWQILYQLLARVGIKLTNTPPKPQSSAINSFYPDFTVNPGTQGTQALKKLLSFVPDQLVFRGQEAFTKNPLPAEESCYTYSTNPSNPTNAHVILAGQYTQAVTLSRSRALGRDDSDNRILEEAQDWDLLQLAIDILEQDYDPNLQDAARAQERADAILREASLRAERGNLTVGTNVGQELLDVVEVTDERCGISEENYRVQAIQTDYDRRKGQYDQRLTIGAP